MGTKPPSSIWRARVNDSIDNEKSIFLRYADIQSVEMAKEQH